MAVELKIGDRFLDRFKIEYLSAEGGMASVYVARDEVTTHQIAIKSLYPYYIDNKTIVSRFLEEGRIQQVLRHPNILRVFQVIEEPSLAILMEYVDGPTLDEFLAQNGALNTEQIVDVIIPTMSAVGFAHSRGIIHRDIKPSNILLQHGDLRTPKILDFGVAKVKRAGGQDLTATGTTVGTLHYMSPEQIVGSKGIDGRADIYSLGVTMYKLAAGEVPFNAPTEFALMMAQVEATPLPPSQINPNIDPDLEAIILKAIAKKPSDRHQSIKDFTSALLQVRMGANKNVEQTMSGSISSEIMNFALMADEIAYESDSAFGYELPPSGLDLPLEAATAEIEATIQTTVPKTQEIGSDAILRLTQSELGLLDAIAAEEETEDMRSLQQRMPKGIDANNTRPDERAFVEATRPSRPSVGLSEPSKLTLEPASQRETRPIPKRKLAVQNPTRPSRPSLKPIGEKARNLPSAPHVPPSPISKGEDEAETISIRQRIDIPNVFVADIAVDSKDMTAPKVPKRDFKQLLADNPRPQIPPSGPRMVIGHNPADTHERTVERPKSRHVQNLIEAPSKIDPDPASEFRLQPGIISPPSDPYEEGRIHLAVRETPETLPSGLPNVEQRLTAKLGENWPIILGVIGFLVAVLAVGLLVFKALS